MIRLALRVRRRCWAGSMKPHLLERDEEGELKVQQVWHGTGKFPAHNIYEDRKVKNRPNSSLLGRLIKQPGMHHLYINAERELVVGWCRMAS